MKLYNVIVLIAVQTALSQTVWSQSPTITITRKLGNTAPGVGSVLGSYSWSQYSPENTPLAPINRLGAATNGTSIQGANRDDVRQSWLFDHTAGYHTAAASFIRTDTVGSVFAFGDIPSFWDASLADPVFSTSPPYNAGVGSPIAGAGVTSRSEEELTTGLLLGRWEFGLDHLLRIYTADGVGAQTESENAAASYTQTLMIDSDQSFKGNILLRVTATTSGPVEAGLTEIEFANATFARLVFLSQTRALSFAEIFQAELKVESEPFSIAPLNSLPDIANTSSSQISFDSQYFNSQGVFVANAGSDSWVLNSDGPVLVNPTVFTNVLNVNIWETRLPVEILESSFIHWGSVGGIEDLLRRTSIGSTGLTPNSPVVNSLRFELILEPDVSVIVVDNNGGPGPGAF